MGSGSSYDPYDPIGEGDAGFGMRFVMDKPKRSAASKKKPAEVKYAAANMYASLVEKGCRRGGAEGGGPPDPWLLYVDMDGTLTAFHFGSGTWHKVRFSVAGQQVIRKAWTGGGARILIELVDKLGMVEGTRKLWNPVTGSLSTLPPFQAIYIPAAFGLSKEKIIAAGCDRSRMYTCVELFSIGAQSWHSLGALPRPYAIRFEDIVECAGNFYALIVFPDHHMLEIRPQGPKFLYVCATPKAWKPYLVNCEGTLYFVGVKADDDTVGIWKLCEGGAQSRWEEVAQALSPCANIEKHVLSVISVGRSVVFCLRNQEVLSFDLGKNAWAHLPLCPEPSSHALKWNPAPHDSSF